MPYSTQPIQTDCLILGGGIAGLWILARLREAGYSALLLEKEALGTGQTIASQGMIHSGLKYALTGAINDTARRIAATAEEWQQALEGQHPVNLKEAQVVCRKQYLLAPKSLFGAFGAFAGEKLFGKDKIEVVQEKNWPKEISSKDFSGQVIAMREPVVDTQSVLSAFLKNYGDCIRQLPSGDPRTMQTDNGITLQWDDRSIVCKTVIVTAAAANEGYADLFGSKKPDVQKRPLKMVIVKGDLPMLWFHGVTGGFRPVVTVSSHRTKQGEVVWYIGGQVAEEGVTQSDDDLFENTRKAIHNFLPRLNLDQAKFSSLYVERVEGKDAQGRLPDAPVWQEQKNIIFAWPTKLTFAPLLAEQILQQVEKKIQPTKFNSDQWQNWPSVSVADYPWDKAEWI